MLRIKCPKCATPLAVDDEDAGGVGECTECGIKFRIPATAAKAKVPAGRGRDEDDEDEDEEDEGEERARRRERPARRRRRDEDDEDDDDDPVDKDAAFVERERKARLARQMSEQTRMNIQMCLSLLGLTVLLGIAGVFINRVAIYGIVFGVVLIILCNVMVSRMARNESIFWFIVTRFVPAMVIVYCILHWELTKRYVIVFFGGCIIVGVSFGSLIIHNTIKFTRRAIILDRIQQVQAPVSRPYQMAWVTPDAQTRAALRDHWSVI